MTTEITVLAWGCVLAFVHIFAAAQAKTQQYGVKWNMGARDEALPPPDPVAGRLVRAQANFFETFPIAAASVLMLAVSGLGSATTATGAWLWLGCRIIYLPLYAAGVPMLRTIIFLASIVGIGMMVGPMLSPSHADPGKSLQFLKPHLPLLRDRAAMK